MQNIAVSQAYRNRFRTARCLDLYLLWELMTIPALPDPLVCSPFAQINVFDVSFLVIDDSDLCLLNFRMFKAMTLHIITTQIKLV